MDFSNNKRNLQIGSYLQTLRLEQNLTLQQLSNLSQVPIIHLTSIEEGHFSKFDNFYLRMYLKRFTQALDVDLEQLYAYASQQPLPDLPDQPKTTNKQSANDRQMTETQACISATPKNVANTTLKRKPALKTVNLARFEAKKKIGRFVVGLAFIAILGVIVFFVVTIIRDLANREPSQVDPPTIVENPHLIGERDGDENGDENDDENQVDETPEAQPEPDDETSIVLVNHIGEDQIFTIRTSHSEIEFRIELSGYSWIGGTIGHTFVNATINHIFEEIFELDDQVLLDFRLGAINHVDRITINGEDVEFVQGLTGAHNLIFYFESE